MARNPRADQIGMGGRMLSVQVGGSSRITQTYPLFAQNLPMMSDLSRFRSVSLNGMRVRIVSYD